MSGYKNVYVEGPEDRDLLEKIFPHLKGILKAANGKQYVLRKVERELDCFGLVDRDYDYSDSEVTNSRATGSRLGILERYCMESYLLEPEYLFAFSEEVGLSHLEDWSSVEAIERYLVRKGQELCFYSAANELLTRMRAKIAFRTLMQKFDDFPVLDMGEVRSRLEERFQGLPVRDEMKHLLIAWEERGHEFKSLCEELEGVHRWIDGKVLLRKVIVQDIRQTDTKRFAKYNDEQLIDDLVDVVRPNPPANIATILQSIGLLS